MGGVVGAFNNPRIHMDSWKHFFIYPSRTEESQDAFLALLVMMVSPDIAVLAHCSVTFKIE